MRYLGGKHRLGRRIAQAVEFYEPVHYHEPFCGMFSVGRHVDAICVSASDIHQDLIMLLKAVRDGWRGPDSITEDYWRELHRVDWRGAIRGYVGFGCSFGGKFFGGIARYPKKGQDISYYAAKMNRSLDRIRPSLQGVSFDCHTYQEYAGQADVLYCDPPYAGTTRYPNGYFDSKEFWDWAYKQSKNRVVLVSELTCPDPRASCVLELPHKYLVHLNRASSVIERVFTFN